MPPVNQRFAEKRASYRGTKFVLREVDAETFDDCVKKATSTSFREDGSEEEMIDQKVLVRLLLERSIIQPKWTVSDFNKQGMRLISQLERDVRELHFSVEPEDKAKDGAKDEPEDDGEGNAAA
jgi:hypothetical protein